jgi:AraC-like DNA-binding protein
LKVNVLIRVDPAEAAVSGASEWRSKLQSTVNGLHQESPIEELGGELLVFSFSGAQLHCLHSDVQMISRLRPCPNRFAPVAIVPLTGGVTMTQLGRTCSVQPGQFAFMDAAAPLDLVYENEFRHLFLHFPPTCFVPAVFHKHTSRTVDGSSDFDLLFRSIIERTWFNAEGLRAEEHGAALNSILSLCPLTSPFRENARQVEPCIRVARAMVYIENNLGEAWLTPQTVAEAQGVSRRYLDDRFGRIGLRIERCIWERRLVRAKEELSLSSRSSRYLAKTIIQIALDNGFKSPSHFSRAFSARFGMSPREFRNRMAAQQTPNLH